MRAHVDNGWHRDGSAPCGGRPSRNCLPMPQARVCAPSQPHCVRAGGRRPWLCLSRACIGGPWGVRACRIPGWVCRWGGAHADAWRIQTEASASRRRQRPSSLRPASSAKSIRRQDFRRMKADNKMKRDAKLLGEQMVCKRRPEGSEDEDRASGSAPGLLGAASMAHMAAQGPSSANPRRVRRIKHDNLCNFSGGPTAVGATRIISERRLTNVCVCVWQRALPRALRCVGFARLCDVTRQAVTRRDPCGGQLGVARGARSVHRVPVECGEHDDREVLAPLPAVHARQLRGSARRQDGF